MFEHWPYLELGTIGVKVLDCEHRTPPAAATGYPYIAIPDLIDGRLALENVRLISGDNLQEWTRRTRPQPGDIIVTRRGRVGDTAVIPSGIDCAIGQNLVILRSEGSLVDQSYLRWASRGPFWRAEVERLHNVGAIFDSLNVSDIPKIRIPVPPIHEQYAIASALKALDDKVEVNEVISRTALDLADSYHRYIAYAELSDPDPDLPLRETAEVIMGQSPPGIACNRDGIGLPLLNGPTEFGPVFPVPAQWTTAPTRTCRVGDILICVRGSTTGRLNRADREYVIGRGIAAIRARSSRQDTEYIYFTVRQRMTDLLQRTTGSVFPNLSRADLESFPISWPEEARRLKFANLLYAFANLAANCEVSNRVLTELRDTLLPKLISGELRIRDTEKLAEDVV
jgi:type I restriction enzyme, S subunit